MEKFGRIFIFFRTLLFRFHQQTGEVRYILLILLNNFITIMQRLDSPCEVAPATAVYPQKMR